ncbi:hypothetical protein [Methylobacterium nigriterrae]|uniref:hypothetical protein n=1 Tax=Methylobacterium nigriterrae TaxID=3127512 RepID=UPI003013B64E
MALLILVLAGLPDERFADLMPRQSAVAAVAAAPVAGLLGGRQAAMVTATNADDPPGDDRRLVPDPPGFERPPASAGFVLAAFGHLSSAGVPRLERPPKILA